MSSKLWDERKSTLGSERDMNPRTFNQVLCHLSERHYPDGSAILISVFVSEQSAAAQLSACQLNILWNENEQQPKKSQPEERLTDDGDCRENNNNSNNSNNSIDSMM